MMVSDEEKRWIVVGIAMNKVAAPVLRDAVKQGMEANYANLDGHCQLLHPPCTLKMLTYGVVQAYPILKNLKFPNINSNHLVHGGVPNYNFNINSTLDLAKLYLPGYLAQFSAFDDSLDMTAILRLLGFKNYMQLPAAVFSPHTQASADDVRENVRNKWGHVDVTEWTDALFNDCFDKLKTLVRSLGLTADVEKNTLDQLDDWQTKGCQLIIGQAVDSDLLSLVQDEVKDLIKDYSTIHSQLNLHNEQVAQLEVNVATLKDQDECKETRLVEHHKRLEALEESQNKFKEITKILERLVSLEAQFSIRLQVVEKEVELLSDEVQLLKKSTTETAAKADHLDERCAELERIGLQLITQKDKPETSCMKSFDLNSCRSKLEDHYQETATVPTSVWCKKSFFDIHRIYTRLSFVKDPEKTPAGATQSELKHYSDLFTAIKKVKDLEKTPAGITSFELKYYTDLFTANKKVKDPEETPAGTTSSELKHYTDLFTANKSGVIPKRILVQGQTGIGKSTFVKKLLVDWVEVNKGAGDEQAALLKNFELVVAVNLKEVSKYQSLVDVIRESNVFAKEDKYMTEGLVDYITNNQEKVLLIFDGYDEYRCGRDSEIYQIFSGNYLRSCCVLITTRISKADDLQGGKVLHAEITGFSEVDREEFMRRFFKNSEDEASELKDHLDEKDLDQLAKVPLLLLFFCILWRKGHSKSFPKSKTTLYMDIIQFILNHSQSKQSPPQYLEVISFKEILSEIGKIALQALLKNDHLFEYSQLCDSVRCDKSVLIGLLQITEYSESEQQVGIVSFIHKSIQEFLAAWYVTYRCIPEGGNLGEIGLKLEECFALENVFEFICGLSKEGAVATFRHLKSVRISDPSLDLSQTAPNLESETDVPLSDVTYRHWQFSDLVLDLFEKVESKADLSRPCLDCLGNVLLFSERTLLKDLLLRTKEANPLSLVSTPTWLSSVNPLNYSFLTMNKVFEMLVTKNSEIFKANPLSLVSTPTWLSSVSPLNYSVLTLNKLVKMLVTENSEIFNVAEFLEKFENMSYGCRCGFSSVLCFFNGQVYLYITHLELLCQDHAGLFTDHVFPSYSLRLSSGHLSLKYLKVLKCSRDGFSMERLGAVVKHCNHLELIDVSDSNDTLSHFLQHVPNYRRCSLLIRFCCLSSKGAVELSYLLPRFENIIHLDLRLAECSDEAVTKLVAAIKHKTLEILTLSETKMTSAAAEALSQSLPQLSVLRTLEISSLTECSDVAVTNLVAAIKHKNLEKLQLNKVNLPLAAAEALSQSLLELSSLQTLTISSLTECSDVAVTKLVAAIKHKSLKELQLSKVNLTSAVAEVLRQSLSELSALESLSIGGVDGCSLQLQIFSSYTLRPLSALTISGCAECSAEAVTRLIDVMKHKPLEKLKLSKIHLTSAAAEALSQSLPALSALQALKICGLAKCSSRAVTSLVASIKHTALNKLTLSEINLTTAVAEALGQSIWKLSALQTLKISVSTECPAEAETSLAAAFKHKPVTELKLSGIELTLEAAEALSQFLWKLSALQTLKISVSTECPAEAVTNLAAAFKHKPITEVILSGIKLTLEAAEALGQSLWKLSALQTLEISVSTECSTETVTGLAAAFKHETLNLLKLSGIKLTLEAGEALGQSLGELSALQTLKISVSTECSAEAVTSLAAAAFKHKPLKELKVSGIKLTLEAAKAMGQSLLEVPHLALELSGFAECSAKEAIRLLEEAIPSRNFIRVMSVVIPHVGYSEFKVKNVVR